MRKKPFLFNRIATFYSFFFNWQVRNYSFIFNNIKTELDFLNYENAIDVGCGTGSLCKVLQQCGLNVTGIDSALSMIKIATKKVIIPEGSEATVNFICVDLVNGIPFEDRSFDMAITSYVAHGLRKKERLILYKEMKRVAKKTVVLIDYNERRSLITDIAEWFEGGDYFNFIKTNRNELINEFGNLKVINTGKHSAIYICKID